MGWRKYHRETELQVQVEEDARGIRVLALACRMMRKLRHRKV